MNWPLIISLILFGLVSSVWIAYAFMKGFNGLLREIDAAHRYLYEEK